MDMRIQNNQIHFGPRKKAFIFYTGLSYCPNFYHCETGWHFDLDMEFGYENHMRQLHRPLKEMGYDVDCAIITNKEQNPKYAKYLQMYKAVDMNYEGDVSDYEIESMIDYFKIRYERFGAFSFGYPIQGFRFLTIQDPLPSADIYIFMRCDLTLKKPLNQINIDYSKINYLWKEEGIHRAAAEGISSPDHPNSGWSKHYRVCGNMLHVVNKRYIKSFLTHFWLEHCSMYAMLRDCDSINLEDFHIVCGDDMYDSCIERQANPIFAHSRKKVEK